MTGPRGSAGERQVIVRRMRVLKREIDELLASADHWNRAHPDQRPLDADPDGTLRRYSVSLGYALAREGVH